MTIKQVEDVLDLVKAQAMLRGIDLSEYSIDHKRGKGYVITNGTDFFPTAVRFPLNTLLIVLESFHEAWYMDETRVRLLQAIRSYAKYPGNEDFTSNRWKNISLVVDAKEKPIAEAYQQIYNLDNTELIIMLETVVRFHFK